MKKNNWFLFVIKLLSVVLVAYVVGFLYSNYSVLRNYSSMGVSSVDFKNIKTDNFMLKDKKLVSTGNKSSFEVSYSEPVYINKIKFNYEISDSTTFTLKYKYLNGNGQEAEEEFEGSTNKNINIFVERLNNKIISYSINFNNETPISINNIIVDNNIVFFSSTYLFFIIVLISIFLLINFRKYISKHIEYLFLILALASGSIIVLTYYNDIGKSWDDQIHFSGAYGLYKQKHDQASYELSDYGILENNVSSFNTDEEKKAFSDQLNDASKNETNVRVTTNVGLGKIAYIPSTISYFILNLFGLPFSILFAVGMFANLIVYSLVMFFAIRKTPICKYLMLVLGLIPTTVFMASSYSYDPALISFLLLGLSYFFYEMHNKKEKIKPFNMFVIISSFVIMSLVKAVYCPIILLLLLLPKEKFNSKKDKRLFTVAVIGITILMLSTFVLPLLTGSMVSDTRGGDTSIVGQIKSILHHPVSFVKTFYNEAVVKFLNKFISKDTLISFAYLNKRGLDNVYFILLGLLFASNYIDNKKEFNIWKKLYIAVVLLIVVGAIWGSMYLSFTPVGATTINGVQNRYFIPLLILFFLLLTTDKIKIDIKADKTYLIYAIGLSFVTFYSVYYNILLR